MSSTGPPLLKCPVLCVCWVLVRGSEEQTGLIISSDSETLTGCSISAGTTDRNVMNAITARNKRRGERVRDYIKTSFIPTQERSGIIKRAFSALSLSEGAVQTPLRKQMKDRAATLKVHLHQRHRGGTQIHITVRARQFRQFFSPH